MLRSLPGWASQTTVKTHVSRLLVKLGARSRSEAVSMAHRAGLVR